MLISFLYNKFVSIIKIDYIISLQDFKHASAISCRKMERRAGTATHHHPLNLVPNAAILKPTTYLSASVISLSYIDSEKSALEAVGKGGIVPSAFQTDVKKEKENEF